MKRKLQASTAVAIVLLIVGVAPALGDTIFNLTNPGIPGGPFVQVDVHLNSTGNATVTFTALVGSFGMIDGNSLALNVNTNLGYTGAFSNLTSNGEPLAISCDLCSTANNISGFGTYNMIFNQHDASKAATTLSVTLTGGGWTDASQVLIGNAFGNEAASHYKTSSTCTFYVGGPGGTRSPAGCASVAEPSSLLLLACSGVVGLLSTRRKLRI